MQLLIAHRDTSVREALSRVAARLSGDGLDVLESGDGAETLETLLGSDAPPLAVVDWDLPGLDGPELCRLVRQYHEASPPYMILIAGPGHSVAEGLDAGAGDCVRTPVDGEELRARIEAGRRIAEQLGHRGQAKVRLAAQRSPFDEDDDTSSGAFELQSVLMRD